MSSDKGTSAAATCPRCSKTRDCPRYLRGESPLPLFLLEENERLRDALASIGREDRLLSPSTLRKLAREALDG